MLSSQWRQITEGITEKLQYRMLIMIEHANDDSVLLRVVKITFDDRRHDCREVQVDQHCGVGGEDAGGARR